MSTSRLIWRKVACALAVTGLLTTSCASQNAGPVLKRSMLLLSAVALGLLMAACAGQTGAPAPTTQEPVVFQDILQQKLALSCEEGKEWWRDPGPPKRGGVFRTATRFNPAAVLYDHVRGGQGVDQVYSRFLQTRSCFYEDTVVMPDVVKSWDVSADGRIWTLKIRDDLKWHNLPPVNGRPLTTADLAWTIDLMVKEGATRTIWNKLTHREPDAHTIILELKEPDPDFLVSTLSERQSIIVPREIYEKHGGYKDVAVGTGPFILKNNQHNIIRELVRNPDWPEKGADGQPLPYLDGITTVVVGDDSAEIAAIRSGQIDRSAQQTLQKLDWESLKQEFPQARFSQDVTGCPWGGFINPMRKPFDDIRVRRAVALALDQEEMIQGALGGGGVPTGYLPVGITQYAWPIAKVKEKFKTDTEEAKRLLVEAGYGPNNPLRFKLHAGQTGNDSGRIEVAQQQLRRIGVETELELMPENSSNYLARYDIANGVYDSMWGTHSPCNYDASRWMGTFYLTGSSRNVIGISDPKLDAMAKAQMSEIDPVKRKQILDQMQDYVFDLRPFFPTDSRTYFIYNNCRVQNMRGRDWHNALTGIRNAWIDPAVRSCR